MSTNFKSAACNQSLSFRKSTWSLFNLIWDARKTSIISFRRKVSSQRLDLRFQTVNFFNWSSLFCLHFQILDLTVTRNILLRPRHVRLPFVVCIRLKEARHLSNSSSFPSFILFYRSTLLAAWRLMQNWISSSALS